MKKLLLLVGFLFLLNSCAPTDYSTWHDTHSSKYKYTASAQSYSQWWSIEYGSASNKSQASANAIALEGCNKESQKQDCYIKYESNVKVWEKNVAHIKAKEEEEKRRKEEEALLAEINIQKALCSEMGFKNETDGMSNCVVKLLAKQTKENSKKKNTSGASSYDIDKLERKIRRVEREQGWQYIQRMNRQMRIQCLYCL